MEWVRSLSQPTTIGLTKDPKPSMVVKTPRPPAAAVLDSSAVGIDQKGPVKAKVADVTRVMTAMLAQGACAIHGMMNQPKAATISGPAACQRRSPLRSE